MGGKHPQKNKQAHAAPHISAQGGDTNKPVNSSKAWLGSDTDRGVTYELFILLVTLLSMAISLARLLIPPDGQVALVLIRVDGIYALILLADFLARLFGTRRRAAYLSGIGLFDLLGSLPAVPFLRFFRLPRVIRQIRLIRVGTPNGFLSTARQHLAQSALLTVAFVVLLVVMFGSVAIVGVEAGAPNANIVTGDDAIWWAIVTIATVGYGDRFPVTFNGRLIGAAMIVMGVSLFSVLTSYFASAFVKPSPPAAPAAEPTSRPELDEIRQSLARLEAAQAELALQMRLAAPQPAPDASVAAGQRAENVQEGANQGPNEGPNQRPRPADAGSNSDSQE